MSKDLTQKLKTWRLNKDDAYESITENHKRLDTVKKLLDEFIPFLSRYKADLNIGYEIDGEGDNYLAVIFRDLNLESFNAPTKYLKNKVMHLRIGYTESGEYFYYIEYVESENKNNVYYTELIKVGKNISSLKEEVINKFGEIEVYTEDESICKDIIE